MKLRLHGSKDMTEAERIEFTQEIAIFVTTFAGEVRDLRHSVSTIDGPIVKGKENSVISKEEICHREDVISYLLEVHKCSSKVWQRFSFFREADYFQTSYHNSIKINSSLYCNLFQYEIFNRRD